MVELRADELLPPGAGPTSQQIAALDGAIVQAFPTFGPLLKDAENTFLKSSYLPLDTLLDDIRVPLFSQGILITSCFQLVRGGFVVTTTLSHSGGGWRSSSFPVGDPSNPQKVAASATYGLRVNLCQLLAIVGRDDDGNAGAPQQQLAQPAAWQQQPPPQQQQPWPGPGQLVGGPIPQPVVVPGPDGRAVTLPPGSPDPHSNQLPPGAWQQQPPGGFPPPGPQPPANSQFV